MTRFRFPTIKDLAASDIDTVNSLWKGLGYYSRAARLLSGAQKVAKELDGQLPDNAKDMQAKIPGIGRYSAGAICSIAYNQCVPVVSLLITFHLCVSMTSKLDVLAGWERYPVAYTPFGTVRAAEREAGSGRIMGRRGGRCGGLITPG